MTFHGTAIITLLFHKVNEKIIPFNIIPDPFFLICFDFSEYSRSFLQKLHYGAFRSFFTQNTLV